MIKFVRDVALVVLVITLLTVLACSPSTVAQHNVLAIQLIALAVYLPLQLVLTVVYVISRIWKTPDQQ